MRDALGTALLHLAVALCVAVLLWLSVWGRAAWETTPSPG